MVSTLAIDPNFTAKRTTLEELAEANKRIWVLETQLGCCINFFKSVFSKDDGDMLEAYIQNELSDEPLEIPTDPKTRLAFLRLMVKSQRCGQKPSRG